MSGTLRIHDPEAQPRPSSHARVARLADLKGKTVGIVDNGWHSFGVAVPRLQELLTERMGVTQVVTHKKPFTIRPLGEEAFQDLVKRADAVIVGLGN